MQEAICPVVPRPPSATRDDVLSTCHWKRNLCGGGSSQSVYLQQFKRTGQEGPALTAFDAGENVQIALLKLNSPAGAQGIQGELAIVWGLWGGCPSYQGEGIEVPSR